MGFGSKFQSGDIISLKRDFYDTPKGTNYLMLGDDGYTYFVVNLHLQPDKSYPYGLMPAIVEHDKLFKKVGEVDLENVIPNLDELIAFADEDEPEKWGCPPDLSGILSHPELKKYI